MNPNATPDIQTLSAAASQAATAKEKTGPQTPQGGSINMGGVKVLFSGTQTPGFGQPSPGTFQTYRDMSSHAVIALVKSIATAPIRANKQEIKARDEQPKKKKGKKAPASETEKRIKILNDCLRPLIAPLLRDIVKGLEYGFAPFELVWGRNSDGHIVPTKIKPLMPDCTEFVIKGNQVVGLKNKPSGGSEVILTGNKAFWWTYDPQFGDPYGRSRHENIRTAWNQCLTMADRIAQYTTRLATITLQLHYPEGESYMEGGAKYPNAWIAQRILENIGRGKSAAFLNEFASLADPNDPAAMEKAINLAGKSKWVLSEFAPRGGDCEGLLKLLMHWDGYLFSGWLRPARVGLESQHGSRADATEHTDTGTMDAQMLDQDIWANVNQNIVNPFLQMNWGEEAEDSIYVEPAPLIDAVKQANNKLIATALQAKDVGPAVAANIDWPAILEDSDVPILDDPKPIKVTSSDKGAANDDPDEEDDGPQNMSVAALAPWQRRLIRHLGPGVTRGTH